MSEYINREDVQDIIDRELSNHLIDYERIMIEYVINAKMDEISSANVVKVRHGHWEQDGHHIRCSECGTYFCITDREGDSFPINYCPCCGAKMDGKEQENE